MRSLIIVSAVIGSAILAGHVAPVNAQEASKARPVRSPVAMADGSTVSKQKRCGMEWKAIKANHTDLTWPKFWHFCSVAVKADASQASKPVGQMAINTK